MSDDHAVQLMELADYLVGYKAEPSLRAAAAELERLANRADRAIALLRSMRQDTPDECRCYYQCCCEHETSQIDAFLAEVDRAG